MQLNTSAYMRRKVTEREVCLASKSSREASRKNVLRLIPIHIHANEKGPLGTIVLNLFLLKSSQRFIKIANFREDLIQKHFRMATGVTYSVIFQFLRDADC